MATALHVQTPEDFSPAAEYSSPWLDRPVAPREEALSLFALVGRNGDTVESIRELIAVPPHIEAALLIYAERNPEEALGIERGLQFRRRVAEEFERVVADSCAASQRQAVNRAGGRPSETVELSEQGEVNVDVRRSTEQLLSEVAIFCGLVETDVEAVEKTPRDPHDGS